MKIASWNVRGLRRKEKKRAVKRLIRTGNFDMLLIQETKIKEANPKLPRWLWGNANFNCEFDNSDGNSGGLLSCWREGFFTMEAKFVSSNFILLVGSILNKSFRCRIGNVYAPNVDSDGQHLWDELTSVLVNSKVPWALGGDFSVVREAEEKIGLTFNQVAIDQFSDFIEGLGLIDLPMSEGNLLGVITESCPLFAVWIDF
ncbi:hypothetical protein DITRI_Ditri03aG0110900 [Diplodiscus trichospermus]